MQSIVWVGLGSSMPDAAMAVVAFLVTALLFTGAAKLARTFFPNATLLELALHGTVLWWASVVGVDTSPKLVEAARRGVEESIPAPQFFVGDARGVGAMDIGAFDRAACVMAR